MDMNKTEEVILDLTKLYISECVSVCVGACVRGRG